MLYLVGLAILMCPLVLLDIQPFLGYAFRFRKQVFDYAAHPADWCLHYCGYGTMAAFMALILRELKPHLHITRLLIGITILVILLGALDEATQAYNPWRTSSVIEFGFDFLGAGTAVGLGWWWHRRKPPDVSHEPADPVAPAVAPTNQPES